MNVGGERIDEFAREGHNVELSKQEDLSSIKSEHSFYIHRLCPYICEGIL